jgi:hypothetical protein
MLSSISGFFCEKDVFISMRLSTSVLLFCVCEKKKAKMSNPTRQKLPAPSPSVSSSSSQSIKLSSSAHLSLTSALLSTSSWISAIQLLLFASSKHIKIQPETLLVAHHRVYQSIPQRPCVLAVALLTHLHLHASLPYRLPRTACAEEARKPPVSLFLDQLTYTCQRGHWMDGLRMVQRCAAFPRVEAEMRTTATSSPTTEQTTVLREVISPPAEAVPLPSAGNSFRSDMISKSSHISHHVNSSSPYAQWCGADLLLENALVVWSTVSTSSASSPHRRVDVAKELLWLVAYSSAFSELRRPRIATNFFRLVYEVVLDHLQCNVSDCCELISTSLRAMERVAAAGYPMATSSAFYSFRAAAQRAALRAVQLTTTTADAIRVLSILTSSASRIAADEEVVLSVFQRHSDATFHAIRFARDPSQHYITDATLRRCIASFTAAASPTAGAEDCDQQRWSSAVELVGSQWRYRRSTTCMSDMAKARSTAVAIDMDIPFLLLAAEQRAEFILYISSHELIDASAARVPQARHESSGASGQLIGAGVRVIAPCDAVRDCIQLHGMAVIKSIPWLVLMCSRGGGGHALTTLNSTKGGTAQPFELSRLDCDFIDLIRKFPAHMMDPLCNAFISAIGAFESGSTAECSEQGAPSEQFWVRLVSWFTKLHVQRGVHPSYLLRFIPRAIECASVHQRGLANTVLVSLLESCVQGPPPPPLSTHSTHQGNQTPLYEVLIPMALHFLVSIVRMPWAVAIQRLGRVAAPWFREQHYFSALTVAPHLIATATLSRPSWEIVLTDLQEKMMQGRDGGAHTISEKLKHAMPVLSLPHHAHEVERIVTAASEFWIFQTLMLLIDGPTTTTSLNDGTAIGLLPPLAQRCMLACDALAHRLADDGAVDRIVDVLNAVEASQQLSCGNDSDAALFHNWSAACGELRCRFPKNAMRLRNRETTVDSPSGGRNALPMSTSTSCAT